MSIKRIVIVTSWPTEVSNGGSGTAVFFNTFVAGLRARGYEVEVIASHPDVRDYVAATLERFLFNTELRTDPRIDQADVVIGFDYDGYGLDPTRRPPMISSAHAVYGDVIQWEVEPYRTMVEAQAYFDRIAMSRADAVTIGSEYAKSHLVSLYELPPEKVTVIPHGEATPTWFPLVSAEPKIPNDHPVILSVGQMYPRKRTEVLLEATAQLLAEFPTLEVRIVGTGIDWDHLHQIADEQRLGDHVTWLGHIKDDAAFAREWRQADIFCHPSSQETFGYVYLEAMKLGKPIVAVRAGSAPEVLGDVGYLAEPEDPVSLAKNIAYVLNHPERWEADEIRAKERASRYTIEAMIDGYVKVIERIARK